ncbi:uncharacterized protein V6R79_017183 [Siganus canaliculatus]
MLQQQKHEDRPKNVTSSSATIKKRFKYFHAARSRAVDKQENNKQENNKQTHSSSSLMWRNVSAMVPKIKQGWKRRKLQRMSRSYLLFNGQKYLYFTSGINQRRQRLFFTTLAEVEQTGS